MASQAALILALLAPLPGRTSVTAAGEETVWDRMMKAQSGRLLQEGALLLDQGHYTQAVDQFARAVVSNPKEPLTHVLLGVAYYWSGQVDNAMSEYREALKLDPKDAQAHQLLGIAWAWKGDVEQAHQEFETSCKLAPDRPDIQMNLGSVLEAEGSLSGALEHFRDAVSLDPKHPLYPYQLGMLYDRLGRDSDARRSFQQALDIYSSYEDALLELGALERRTGHLKEAIALLERAVKNKPRDAVARFLLAAAQWQDGQRAKAAATLREAFHISPLEEGGRIALSVAYRGGQDQAGTGETQPSPPSADGEDAPKDPIELFKRNLARLPAEKTARIEVELVYLPKPELKVVKSREEGSLKRALEGGPTPIAVKREFVLPAGDPAARQKQIDTVAEDLRNTLKSRPPGQVHLGMNIKYDNAPSPGPDRGSVGFEPRQEDNDLGLWVIGTSWVELVKENMEDLPADARVVKGLGHLTLGEADPARSEFQEALRADPANVPAALGMGVAFVVAGREAEAAEAFRKVQKIDPKNAAATEALRWIERGAKHAGN